MRIAVASFSHETCTFCPRPTTIEDFEYSGVKYGDEVLESSRGIPSYINGFIKTAEKNSDVELIGILSASRSRGGSSGSWLTKECFDKYSNEIAEKLRTMEKVDGVLLALHGAMAATGYLKPEAEIVRRVRDAVGDTPIMVTLDLHANEDHELTEAADAVFILKTYPHVDSEKIGETACQCMIDTIKGVFKPTMAIKKPGIITPSVYQWTEESPGSDIMSRAEKWEKNPGCYSVSVAFGFAYADVPDVGATVIAVTNDNQRLAEEIVEDVSNFIWSLRKPFAGKILPKPKEGVEQAIRLASEQKTPVIIADHSDRTGDSTHILEELLRQEAENFCIATLADKSSIEKLLDSYQVGSTVGLEVAGKLSEWSGEPVKIEGEVTYLDDVSYVHNGPMSRGATVSLGKVAVIRLKENNHIVLTENLHQVIDDAIFPVIDLKLHNMDVVVLKSRVHFRAFYEDVAGSIVVVDAPGLGPADLSILEYRNIPENVYPIRVTQ